MFRVAIIDTLNSRVHAVDLKHKPPTVADFVSLLEASNLFGNLHNVVGIRKQRSRLLWTLMEEMPEELNQNICSLVFSVSIRLNPSL